MEENTIMLIDTVLNWGWPAVVLLQCIILWRKLSQRDQELYDVLREVAGLRTTLRVETQTSSRNRDMSDSDVEAVRRWRQQHGPPYAKDTGASD